MRHARDLAPRRIGGPKDRSFNSRFTLYPTLAHWGARKWTCAAAEMKNGNAASIPHENILLTRSVNPTHGVTGRLTAEQHTAAAIRTA